jgi:hypothetical protein
VRIYELTVRLSKLVARRGWDRDPATFKEFADVRDDLGRCCFAKFTELLQMLRMFPQRQQWEQGDLTAMRMEMIEAVRRRAKKARG